MVVPLLAVALAAPAPRPRLVDLRVSDGSVPFAGDRRLLTTVSPNGDGFRDSAIVHFRLTRPATVRMDVVATEMLRAGATGTHVVWNTKRAFPGGPGQLVWRPTRSTQPRTYIVRLHVGGHVYG